MKLRPLAISMTCALLAGCAVGPDYERPAALKSQPLPKSFAGDWKTAQPAAHLPRGAWWEVFKDAELNRLESAAMSANESLAASVARFNQARALVDIARSDFFPQLSFNGSATRERTSKNEPSSGKPAGQAYNFNTFTVPLEMSWEPDLWGRIRRRTEAASARLSASADDVEAVRLAIQGAVAADYFALRTFDAELALVADTVETFRRSLELTRNRRKGGVASDLDVSEAETQLRTAEGQLPALQLQRAKLGHALATLCGQPAMTFTTPANPTQLLAPPAVPPTLPSELLERRPDIAATERQMAAANADVGVAQCAFFPRLVFDGLAGFQSINAGTVFNWPSRVWAVGPTLELPIFTGGRNTAQLAAARAAYDETVANYRQTVLTAFQEIEDQLAAQQLLVKLLDAETAALAAASRTQEIANNRYRAGLVTYLEVATAQSAAFDRNRAVVRIQGERCVATVGLIKALGGGWQSNTNAVPVQR
ncbi:MAG: efflux transporter outer membrane subunit [Verrucomicrobia bacterium]|nr:efflux transporter outer membrane subunit [Verrucomicrobiota bacterium]